MSFRRRISRIQKPATMGPVQPVSSTVMRTEVYNFSGTWKPGNDAPFSGGFKQLLNYRYSNKGSIELCAGCSKITSNMIGKTVDYTDETEIDPAGRLTVAASSITVTTIDEDESSYVFIAETILANENYRYTWTTKRTDSTFNSSAGLFMLSNSYGTIGDILANNENAVMVYAAGDDVYLRIIEVYGGTPYSFSYSKSNILTQNTNFYFVLEKDVNDGTYGSVVLSIYSDSGYETLLATLTHNYYNTQPSFSYRHSFAAFYSLLTGKSWSGVISDLREIPKATSAEAIQFRSEQTTESRLIVRYGDKVYIHQGIPPATGDFIQTPLHINVESGLTGRFSAIPNGGVAYCNGKESMIYAGDEVETAATYACKLKTAISYSDLSFTSSTISTAGGDFVAAGFKAGQRVDITSCSVDGNKMKVTLKNVASGVITVNETLVAGGPGASMTAEIMPGFGGIAGAIEYQDEDIPIGGMNDSFCKALLVCDDSDGATTFTDSSSGGSTHNFTGKNTYTNKCVIDTSEGLFGNGSIYCDGSAGSFAYTAGHSDLSPGTNRFTISCFIKIPFDGAFHGIFNHNDGSGNNNVTLKCMAADSNIAYFLIDIHSGGTTIWSETIAFSRNILPIYDTWLHIALIRGFTDDDDVWALCIDGTFCVTKISSTAYPSLAATNFEICTWQDAAGGDREGLGGYMTHFEFTNGIARWTRTFSPPKTAYKEAYSSLLIMTTRPPAGYKVTVSEPNKTVSSLSHKVWNGYSFTDVTLVTDNTKVSSVALNQTGTVEIESTTSTAKPFLFRGVYFYALLVTLSAGQAKLSKITADLPFQKMRNVWDGVNRTAISVNVFDGNDSTDWTYDTAFKSHESLPIGAEIGGLGTSGYIELAFDEPARAFNISMVPGKTSKSSAVPTCSYWNGSEYVNATWVYDTTNNNETDHVALSRSGKIILSPVSDERPTTKNGIYGYFYKIEFDDVVSRGCYISGTTIAFGGTNTITDSGSAFLSSGFEAGMKISVSGSANNNGEYTIETVVAGTITTTESTVTESSGATITITSAPDEVVIDTITGIPASEELEVKKFLFPAIFRDRLMLCGCLETDEQNRIDYSMSSAPDVFNGKQTSMDGVQSPYLGDGAKLTAARQLYNRFGSNIYSLFIVFKENSMFVVSGDDPESFQVLTVSGNIGCPAPRTLTAIDGIQLRDGARNVLMWLTHSGPYMFDGAELKPVPGIEWYFDQNRCDSPVSLSNIENSSAAWDQERGEWNLIIPTGSSSVPDTWLVFDPKKPGWFQKTMNGTMLDIFSVVGSSGEYYLYTIREDGHLVRLENGTNNDGNSISYTWETSDFTLGFGDKTTIRHISFVGSESSASGSMSMSAAVDTNDSASSIGSVSFTDGSSSHTKTKINTSLTGWAHRIKGTISSATMGPGDATPTALVIRHRPEMEDL